MVSYEIAQIVKKRALRSVEELSRLLYEIQEQCSEEEFEIIRRGVGLSIGKIQTKILDHIYSQYPDMSHID